jgi:outer membrane lipoprotein SlyB
MKRFLAAFLSCGALTVWAQTCLVCGEIRSIREVHSRGTEAAARTTPGSPSGLDTGPVVGTVAQFHFGGGKADNWTFGAAGTPEMQARLGETTYEVTVAMDMGERRVLQRRDGNRFHVGQRVALRSGELEPM